VVRHDNVWWNHPLESQACRHVDMCLHPDQVSWQETLMVHLDQLPRIGTPARFNIASDLQGHSPHPYKDDRYPVGLADSSISFHMIDSTSRTITLSLTAGCGSEHLWSGVKVFEPVQPTIENGTQLINPRSGTRWLSHLRLHNSAYILLPLAGIQN
jgi:hypothetical protein